jgi:hypothetical protein
MSHMKRRTASGICVGLLWLLNPVSAVVAIVLLVMLDMPERYARWFHFREEQLRRCWHPTTNCARTSMADSVLVGCYWDIIMTLNEFAEDSAHNC